MVKIYFRHERPRPFQRRLMADIYSSIAEGKNFMAYAPTGSGKTDSALSAAVSYALEHGKDIFFLTPKISQHNLAMDVVSGIGKKHDLNVRAVDLIGKKHACIDPELMNLDGESLYHLCDLKRKKNKCKFFNNISGKGLGGKERSEKTVEKIMKDYGHGKNHSEVMEFGKQNLVCPYELMMKIGAASNVIIGDYYHLVVPSIRQIILNKTGKRVENSIVIIDEAHNLAPRVRNYLSSAVNTLMLKRVEKEMRSIGYKASGLEERFNEWAGEMLENREELKMEKEDFYEFLMGFENDFFSSLEDAGISYITATGKKSAALKFAQFVQFWDDPLECVRILKKDYFGFSVSRRMLDPSALTNILNETHSTILMSATLVPLEMHRDVLGLKKTIMKGYPSPFSPHTLRNIICSGVTTKFTERNEDNFMNIAEKINKIDESTPGGVAIFFPSYEVMKQITPHLANESIFFQESKMRPKEIRSLIDDFRKKGGLLCGVQGGSLAEGVDYSKGEIKTIVIVGVALDEMNVETQALIDYYENKFGKGWEYGYLYPGTIKALQAAGRGRRKDADRVAVVYMDERFKWKKYNWIFDRKEKTLLTSVPEKYVSEFWMGK